jgi:hypothetical protein
MVPMYDAQQSVEESLSFCFETRIRYDRVVAGDEGKGDVAAIGSLQVISMVLLHCGVWYVPGGLRRLVFAREQPAVGT